MSGGYVSGYLKVSAALVMRSRPSRPNESTSAPVLASTAYMMVWPYA